MSGEKVSQRTNRISPGFKLLMWVMAFQILTLGLVLSLWAVEMGRPMEYANTLVQALAFAAAAVAVSPYLFEGYYELKNWYATGGTKP